MASGSPSTSNANPESGTAYLGIRLTDPDVQKHVQNGSLLASDVTTMSSQNKVREHPFDGFLLGGVLGLSLRARLKPSPSLPLPYRIALSMPVVVLGSSVCGSYVGHRYAKFSTLRRLATLQNPEGYMRAVAQIHADRLKKKGEDIGLISWTYGVIMAKPRTGQAVGMSQSQDDPSEPMPEADIDYATFEESSDSGQEQTQPMVAQSAPATTGPPPQQGSNATRWEEIRKEKSVAQQTSWDLIRQSYERERLPPSASPDAVQNAVGSSENNEPREDLTEQEKFDAMVEAERRANAESPDTYGQPLGEARRWR